MIFTFFCDEKSFKEWYQESQARMKQQQIGIVFKSLDYVSINGLIILKIEYVLPNIIPQFFFKMMIKKALKKHYAIKMVSHAKALDHILGALRK